MTSEQVFVAASGGEPWAQGIVESSVHHLASAIATVRMVTDPELVVIGGGVGLAEGYVQALRSALSSIPMTAGLQVRRAALGVAAGQIGAADLAAAHATEAPASD